VKGLDLLSMGVEASIGRLNWITGYPSGRPPHFMHQTGRHPELVMAAQSGITNRHIVDCTDRISIDSFSIVAGFRSQLLTHSINLATNRQEARPITIGRYCFVGTASTLLGGASLPDYCVLGANSLLNKSFTTSYRLYGGVPAAELGELDPQLAYFLRDNVFVV
jgi:acetyltransferase-like isoleucine patch superfamily enzyme